VTLHDLPLEIQQHIFAKATSDKHVSSPNTYSLTDLLYCVRKAWFKRKKPKPLSLESAYNIYRGKWLDKELTSLFPDNQKRITYKCERIPRTITGQYDFITSDGVMTDLKTTKNLYFVKEVSEEYQKQVRFYAYNASVSRGQIIYMDFGDAKVFEVPLQSDERPLMRELEQQATVLYTTEKQDNPPSRQCSWLCGMCEYKIECEATPQ